MAAFTAHNNTGLFQQCIQLSLGEKSVLSANILQQRVEVVNLECLMIWIFNLLDYVFAKARRDLVRKAAERWERYG